MIFNATQLDTTPGSGHWAAPTASVDDYTTWLRERFREDRAVRQYLWHAGRLAGKHGLKLDIAGPYAAELEAACMATYQPDPVAQTRR